MYKKGAFMLVTIDSLAKFLAFVGGILGIINSIAILQDRRLRLSVEVTSHKGTDDRGKVTFAVTNPGKRAISIRSIRLFVYGKQEGWRCMSDKPQGLSLPYILEGERRLDGGFSPMDTFGTAFFEKFYITVETDLKGKYKSKVLKIP